MAQTPPWSSAVWDQVDGSAMIAAASVAAVNRQ